MVDGEAPKPLQWLGTSKSAFLEFPPLSSRTKCSAKWGMRFTLPKSADGTMAKTLTGFGGGSVVEVRESDESGTYRAVYTVRYLDCVYVLHAFQKKSKAGVKTAKADIELIERRLKALIAQRERQ